MFNKFFRKLCRLSETVQKYGTAGQVIDDNRIRRMPFACWIAKVTTQTQYTRMHYLLLDNGKNGCVKTPQFLCLYERCLSCLCCA